MSSSSGHLGRRPILICGVRPQYVKVAAFLYELERRLSIDRSMVTVIDTGQHYDAHLSGDVLRDLELEPDIRIEHPNRSAAQIFSRSLLLVEEFLHRVATSPAVVVFGDADPALAGALAARRCAVPLLHVEAGARRDPTEREHWNSKLVDVASDMRFALTARAGKLLEAEGLAANTLVTGDLAIDWYRARWSRASADVPHSAQVLVTLHRPGNMTRRCVGSIAETLKELGLTAVWIEHPRNRQLLRELVAAPSTIRAAASPTDIASLVRAARFIITDSGGLAREAHWLGRPAIMRRASGGWPELIEAGVLRAVRTDSRDEMREAIRWAERWVPSSDEASPLRDDVGASAAFLQWMPRFLEMRL